MKSSSTTSVRIMPTPRSQRSRRYAPRRNRPPNDVFQGIDDNLPSRGTPAQQGPPAEVDRRIQQTASGPPRQPADWVQSGPQKPEMVSRPQWLISTPRAGSRTPSPRPAPAPGLGQVGGLRGQHRHHLVAVAVGGGPAGPQPGAQHGEVLALAELDQPEQGVPEIGQRPGLLAGTRRRRSPASSRDTQITSSRGTSRMAR